jgi:hypothetical protein
MPSRDLVEARQVSKSRRSNLASVWSATHVRHHPRELPHLDLPLSAIRHNEHTHLTLGRLNSAVCLTRWDSVSFSEKQKVVNQSLHVLLHRSSWWRANLVVLGPDGASGHLVETLEDDAEGLTELFHAAAIVSLGMARESCI